MRIEHIAIYVNDLERAKNFFTHYSHAAAGEKYHNQKECGKKVCKKSALNTTTNILLFIIIFSF